MGLRTADWAHILLLPLLLSAGALTAVAATADPAVRGISSSTRPVGSTHPGMDHGSASEPAMDGMEGMDHGGAATPDATPTPDGTGMDGMDHGDHNSTDKPATPDGTPAPESTDMPGMDGMDGMDGGSADADHGDHGSAAEPDPGRPLAPVLGTFGAGNALVLLAAGLLRRRDRAARLAKQAHRGGRAHS